MAVFLSFDRSWLASRCVVASFAEPGFSSLWFIRGSLGSRGGGLAAEVWREAGRFRLCDIGLCCEMAVGRTGRLILRVQKLVCSLPRLAGS